MAEVTCNNDPDAACVFRHDLVIHSLVSSFIMIIHCLSTHCSVLYWNAMYKVLQHTENLQVHVHLNSLLLLLQVDIIQSKWVISSSGSIMSCVNLGGAIFLPYGCVGTSRKNLLLSLRQICVVILACQDIMWYSARLPVVNSPRAAVAVRSFSSLYYKENFITVLFHVSNVNRY